MERQFVLLLFQESWHKHIFASKEIDPNRIFLKQTLWNANKAFLICFIFFSALLLDGCIIGGKTGALYDRRIAKYSVDLLKIRLNHIPPHDFYPLMHEPRKEYDAVALPKIIRERDTEYQFYRLLWFQRLLHVSVYIS